MSMANVVMLGNVTNLHTPIAEYEKHLGRIYKTITKGKTYPRKPPLFRPIHYYKEIDMDLAKAHQIVRAQYYNSKNYVTHLDEAAQSRFSIFIVLDDSVGMTTEELIEEAAEGTDFRPLKNQPHKKEFLEELDKCFLKEGDPLIEVPRDFYKAVRRFLAEYLYREPNNFVLSAPLGKEGGKKVNTHILNAQVALMSNMLYLNKLYWGEEVVFTEDDKQLIRYYESFNYNSLNSKEASMSIRPNLNNYILDSDEIEKNYEDMKETYNTDRMIERKMQSNTKMKIALPEYTSVMNKDIKYEPGLEEDIFK